MDAFDVIVVGGGPVGMMTAALLDSAGVQVAVFERNSEPSHQTRGSTMHPRTLEMFSTLDAGDGRRVSDVLLAQGLKVSGLHYGTLPDFLDYRGLDSPFPFGLMIAQHRTEAALAALLRHRGVPVYLGAEVTEVEQTEDQARIRCNDRWYSAKYLVGADGARSTVRNFAGVEFSGTTPDEIGYVADVFMTHPPQATFHYWNQDFGSASVVPLTDTTTRVFGILARDIHLTAEEVRARQAVPLTTDDVRNALIGVTGQDFGMQSASWLSKSSNSARLATSFRNGRIFLAGDAAHVHFPAGGQGLNVGIQDAANLAWKLAAELQGWAPERLISGAESYDAERRPIAEHVVFDTQVQDALMHTFSPAGAALRQLFSSFIAQGGEVAQKLAGSVSGIAVAYPQHHDVHELVGTRAPDLVLTEGNLQRQLQPDRFLLLDFASNASLASFASMHVEVRTAPLPVGSHRTNWADVQVALIRPDGYIAHAGSSTTGLTEAIASWIEPTLQPANGQLL